MLAMVSPDTAGIQKARVTVDAHRDGSTPRHARSYREHGAFCGRGNGDTSEKPNHHDEINDFPLLQSLR